jgi:hypothetical protein
VTAAWALALLAGVLAYSATADDRLPQVVGGVGAAGLVVTALALVGRWPSLLPWGIVGVGAAYAVLISLHGGTVDSNAPFVAAALFAAAELAFWSIEPHRGSSERAVLVRQTLFVCVGALGTALVGALLLVAVAETTGGVAYEALGVGAAVVIIAIVAVLTARSRDSVHR